MISPFTPFDLVMKTEIAPAIHQWSFEDLGDDPASHRWRAQWSYTWDGECDGIMLTAHQVLKATRCGVWITQYSSRKPRWVDGATVLDWEPFEPWMKRRFVNNGSMQAWAKPTREEAMHSLGIRLTRWTTNIRKEVEKARAAAHALLKLRPDDAFLANTALDNLKGIEKEDWL